MTRRYRLIAARFSQITEQPATPGGQPGYTRHRRGAILELDDTEAARLLKARAIVALEDDEAETTPQEAAAAAEPLIDSTDISAGTKGPVPPKAGTKDLWVEYAVDNGLDRAAAEAMTKPDLIARFGTGN